jgi:predicted PhzF superfamily epimerase YddE/YHI9/ribosomal protein S18 acetylase RimI-like enzyme
MDPERERGEDKNHAAGRGKKVDDDDDEHEHVNHVSPSLLLDQKVNKEEKKKKTASSSAACSFLPKTLAFREVGPTDLETCFAMEQNSYPANEAASKSTLQYRQHHAAKYFRCATVCSRKEAEENEAQVEKGDDICSNRNNKNNSRSMNNKEEEADEQVIGYICSTRCHEFTAASMTLHSTSGPLLAIHSVVVRPDYQRRGIATAMLQDYIASIVQEQQQQEEQDQQQQQQQQQKYKTSTTVVATGESAPSSAGSGGGGPLIKSSSNNSLSKQLSASSTNIINAAAAAAKPLTPPIEKIVLLSKKHLLTFYIHGGNFSVIRPSPIVHGSETWYELERVLPSVTQQAAAAAATRRTRPCCYVVDAFCDAQRRGTGNPAAIVVLDATTNIINNPAAAAAADGGGTLTAETARWMQTVAQEFNLAETAFVWPVVTAATTAAVTKGVQQDEDNNNNNDADCTTEQEAHYYIRYFTPTMEVNLCGHATLAAASILFQFSTSTAAISGASSTATTAAAAAAVAPDATIVFHARHDLLRANLAPSVSASTAAAAAAAATGTSRPTRIAMEFPSKPAVEITNEDDIAAIKAMLTCAFDIHCHPEHEEDDYSEDEGEESSNIRFLGLSPPDIGDLLVELTPACFQQVLGGGSTTSSRRQQRQRSPPTSIQTNATTTTAGASSSSSSIIVSSDDEQDEVVQRPIRYSELLKWDGYR